MAKSDGIRRTVLFVEDDAEVRSVGAVILGELGYRVIEASSAEDAMEILRAQETIDLLMTDLAMPGIGGMELAHLAKRARPSLKVLYTSAYVRAVESSPALRHGPLIEKPWMLQQLQGVVEKLIGPGEVTTPNETPSD
ncbi:MAG: response regulator [Pseudomonadota bacterium]